MEQPTATDLRGAIDVEALRGEVEAGRLDTVLLCLADMQGRLQGKRLMPRFFLDSVLSEASEGCNYLLAVDVEMTPVPGYRFASWDQGYGDFVMVPDLGTLRRAAWQEGAAILLCDIALHDGTPAPVTAAESQKTGSDLSCSRSDSSQAMAMTKKGLRNSDG